MTAFDLSEIPREIAADFLVAGNATLIRHFVEDKSSRWPALISNEFGDVAIATTCI